MITQENIHEDSPTTLPKGTGPKKSPQAEETSTEKLRRWIGNCKMLLLQLLVQWVMATNGLGNVASHKLPLFPGKASGYFLWFIIVR